MLYWRKFFVLSRKVLLVVSISFKHLQTRRVGWYSVLCTLCSLPRSLRPSVQVGFLPVAFWTAAVIAVIIIERPSVRLEQRNHESRVSEQRTRTSRVGH